MVAALRCLTLTAADSRQDILVLRVDAPVGQNAGFYRMGRNLDAKGVVSGGWSDWTGIPDWFSWSNQGAGLAIADLDGSSQPNLLLISALLRMGRENAVAKDNHELVEVPAAGHNLECVCSKWREVLWLKSQSDPARWSTTFIRPTHRWALLRLQSFSASAPRSSTRLFAHVPQTGYLATYGGAPPPAFLWWLQIDDDKKFDPSEARFCSQAPVRAALPALASPSNKGISFPNRLCRNNPDQSVDNGIMQCSRVTEKLEFRPNAFEKSRVLSLGRRLYKTAKCKDIS